MYAFHERPLEGIEDAKIHGVFKGRIKGTKESKNELMKKYPEVVELIQLKKSLRDISS
jgi:hypothetical protein